MRTNQKTAILSAAVLGLVYFGAPSARAVDLTWLGTASTAWDVGGAANWFDGTTAVPFTNGSNSFFTDFSTNNTVDVTATVLPASVTFNNTAVNYTLGGVGKISGTTNLTKSGNGTTIIGNSNDYTGGTVVGGGTLSTGGGVNPNAGTLLTAFGTGSIQISSGGTLQIGYTTNTPISNTLVGTGSLIAGTTGNTSVVYIDGTNPNFDGGVRVLDGTDFRVKVTGALGSGSAAVNVGAATLFTEIAADQTFSRPLNFTGAGTLGSFASGNATTSATSTISGTVTLGANVVARVDQGTLTLAGVIGGAGRLNKTNNGTLILANPANTFTGGVQFEAGRLVASSDGNFGAVPAAATPGYFAIGASAGTILLTDNFTLAANRGVSIAGTGTFDVPTGKVVNIAGSIVGVSLYKRDAGRLDLSGSNTFTGAITIGSNTENAGALRITNSNAVAGATVLSVNDSSSGVAVFELDGGVNITVPSIKLSGGSSQGAAVGLRAVTGTNTFNGTADLGNIGGNIYRVEALTGSKLVINGDITSTLTGAATVRTFFVGGAGTVDVTGSMSDGLQLLALRKVDAGSTLNLFGTSNTYTAGTTVDASTTLNIGRTFNNGTLTLNGNLSLIAGATAGDVARTSQIATLAFGSAGRINVTNNALIINTIGTNTRASLEARVKLGYNGGLNNGGTGSTIFSSTAAGVTSAVTLVGVADSTDLGSPASGTFNGAAYTTASTFIRYTFAGDADLSGTVTSTDFNQLVAGYGKSDATVRWYTGDTNYDGTVDTVDFARLIGSFGRTLPAAGPASLPGIAPGALVPEPATLSLLATAGALRLRRRRR